jgi:TonB family protein
MKTLTCLILLTLISSLCRAQYISTDSAKVEIVSQDTINIKGRVLDAAGQPLPYVFIVSKNRNLAYKGYPLYTASNQDGEFTLNGALPVDTLEVNYKNHTLTIVNNNSRYVEITFPQIIASVIGGGEISAKRITAKKALPKFKVVTGAVIMDYFGIPIEVDARYPGNFIKNLKSGIIYPPAAIKNNIEGEVQVQFTIDRGGNLVAPKIIKGIGYGCDEAVINAFKNCYKWSPAISNGHAVPAQYIVSIQFKLNDK